MALWDDVKKNLVEWYTFTSDKTTEAARVSSRRWDKFGISRDIERQFSELGSLVYVGLKEEDSSILASEEVQTVVQRIENLEKELAEKSEEIENIRSEYSRTAAAGGGGEAAQTAGNEEDLVTETVITDPVLDQGSAESAILVEPPESLEKDTLDEPEASEGKF